MWMRMFVWEDSDDPDFQRYLVEAALDKHEVLDSYDLFLARYDVSTIHSMTRAAKREWLRHLDAAREAFEKQRIQWAQGQNSIMQYFPVLNVRSASRGAAPN